MQQLKSVASTGVSALSGFLVPLLPAIKGQVQLFLFLSKEFDAKNKPDRYHVRYMYLIGVRTMSVSLRLPDDLTQRLNHLAAKTGRTKTFYMLEAIKQHLDDLEDLYLAEQRLLDVRAGRSMIHSIDDVERRLGLAD